jgi:hypothetical protein
VLSINPAAKGMARSGIREIMNAVSVDAHAFIGIDRSDGLQNG